MTLRFRLVKANASSISDDFPSIPVTWPDLKELFMDFRSDQIKINKLGSDEPEPTSQLT